MKDLEEMRSESWGSSLAAWEAMGGYERLRFKHRVPPV